MRVQTIRACPKNAAYGDDNLLRQLLDLTVLNTYPKTPLIRDNLAGIQTVQGVHNRVFGSALKVIAITK